MKSELGTNFNSLPTDSANMTERAMSYLHEFPNALMVKLVSPLSPKQQECADYIDQFYIEYGQHPSVRNIAKALGISTTAAHHRVQKVKQINPETK